MKGRTICVRQKHEAEKLNGSRTVRVDKQKGLEKEDLQHIIRRNLNYNHLLTVLCKTFATKAS